MSDFQEPISTDFKDDEASMENDGEALDCVKNESPQSSMDGNRHENGGSDISHDDVRSPRMNGFANGDHPANGHISDDEEYEIDIDPRMDMMMLEPQVDIIEDPEDIPTPFVPNPQQEPTRQPSIFRRKRFVAPKPVTPRPAPRRQPAATPRANKRRIISDEISDDRSGCRSLVCDSSGIIIAEMVFRCMICAHVSDAISSAHEHYELSHMSRQSPSRTSSVTNRAMNGSVPPNFDTEDDHDDIELEASRGRPQQNGVTNQNVQQNVPSNSQSYLEYNYSDSLSAEDEGSDFTGSEPLKKPGNFVTAPTPTSYVPGRNSKTNQSILGASPSQSSSATRGGYVTCAVCSITKFYASVQRRYGQFTCMGCAKFFGRFLLKPKRYFCPNLGSCSLESSPRCKACLLAACINTYVIDEKRMKIVNANRPLKKAAPSTPSRNLPVHTSVQNRQPQPLPQKQVTNPTSFGSGNHEESMTFAPPPLVKAPVLAKVKTENSNNYASLLSAVQSSSSELTGQRRGTPVSTPTTTNRSNGSAGGRKGTGCRQCANCLSDDCGKCNYCLDKPKFGGPNTLKKKCIQKKCLLVQSGASVRVRIVGK